MKRKQTLWRIALLILAGILIGGSVYRWNARNLGGDRMPMPLGFGVSVVLTGSMEPTLSVNDLVVIQKTQDVALGDVVVFQDGSDLVIHRVIALEGDTLQTQGDANNAPDAPMTLNNVKGKLLFAVPAVGAVVNFLKQPPVVILLLVGAFALTELSYRREKSNDADELEDIKAQIRALAADIRNEDE